MPVKPPYRSVLLHTALVCAVLLATLWLALLDNIDRDRAQWEARALHEVRALADSYAEQLHKAVEQIDHLSSTLAYMQEQGALPALLDAPFRYGAGDSPIYVAYVDAAGVIRGARHRSDLGSRLADAPFFSRHRDAADRHLTINPRARGHGTLVDQQVVRFTRRVERRDGGFGGVIAVTVLHQYLHWMRAPADPRNGCSSAWLQDGTLLTDSGVGLDDQTEQHFREPPRFAEAAGARLLPGELFFDGRPYYVGWRRLDRYPLLAVRVLPQAEALAGFLERRDAQLMLGLYGSALVLAGGLAIALLQLRRAEKRRRVEALQGAFRSVVDAGRDAYLLVAPVYDARGQAVGFRVEDCSRRTAELTGQPCRALTGRRLDAAFPPAAAAALDRLLRSALRDGYAELEWPMQAADGQPPRPLFHRAVRFAAGIALTMHDMTDQKARDQALQTVARTDPLTALPNRLRLQEQVRDALQAASTANGKVGLVFIDIHNFKRINELLGHAAGDRLLLALGRALKQAVRAHDQVARVGGDKFALLIGDLAGQPELEAAVARVRGQLRLHDAQAEWSGFEIAASVGAALFPDDAADAEALENAAELAMYEAKAAGKGAVVYYAQAISDRLRSRFQLEVELRQAVQNDELVLYYQPRVFTASGEMSSLEALVRWRHPQRGLVLPAEFIPVAEESGLIVDLGHWVVDRACRQLTEWRQQGLPLRPVAINVSAEQLRAPGFARKMAASMQAHGVLPAQLAVELTESTMVGDDVVTLAELRALRELGVELHIDDFGTGYSSLSRLQQLDVDVIKIDRSFVKDLTAGGNALTLCRAIVRMCKALGFTVVAEGVETRGQFEILRKMDCDELQGYLVARPVPAADAAAMLRHPALFAPVEPQPVAMHGT